ncbi:MAG TPA: type II toxin-antitoxin system prevent-host-death family antitoxin [Acidobacteriaceae bacterium]|nr:type II toxin-antitoxin system prevent-host-death family antitoxin [Acidobacteriaceae bacterium]
MKSVQIGELKNKLSGYLRDVRQGEEIIVRDRNLPIAKIIPYVPDSIEEQHRILIATGQMTQSKSTESHEEFVKRFLARPRPKVPGRVAIQALLDEREEGW